MNKFLSRKFLLTVIAAISNIVILFGLKIDAETKKQAIVAIDSVLALYITVEGVKDVATVKRQSLTNEEIKKIAEKILKP